MIESLFMMCIAIAFLTFILGIEKESMVYTGLSTILWLLVMLSATSIIVPNADTYYDLGFSAFCLAFIFINIIWMIRYFFSVIELRERKRTYKF